jgi:hypothetical protein
MNEIAWFLAGYLCGLAAGIGIVAFLVHSK